MTAYLAIVSILMVWIIYYLYLYRGGRADAQAVCADSATSRLRGQLYFGRLQSHDDCISVDSLNISRKK